ncbi:MAG TPA: Clp protease [Myxococcales bacterium]|nr:Clp protease [Myxococcales bacterium]
MPLVPVNAQPVRQPNQVTPTEIFEALRASVLGQDEVLRPVALAIHKHTTGAVPGNLLLVGNSGTGKTTIMRAVQRLFRERPEYAAFRAMAVINANLLVDAERLEFRPDRLLAAVEGRARAEIGHTPSAEELERTMARATICIDEIDKMSAKLAGKANPIGIALQQGLLTLMEGSLVPIRCRVRAGERDELRTLEIDTRRMMFICGGAFEGLYEQVYARVIAPGSGVKLRSTMVQSADGNLRFETRFALGEFFRMEDLFEYGMVPQFASRFESVLLLAELTLPVLQQILREAPESPFRRSQAYFAAQGIALEIDAEAAALIAEQAERSARMGARALRAVFSRVVAPLEFDPWGSGALQPNERGGFNLLITGAMVRAALQAAAPK